MVRQGAEEGDHSVGQARAWLLSLCLGQAVAVQGESLAIATPSASDAGCALPPACAIALPLLCGAEEARRKVRGNRHYKVHYPGDEEDKDEEAIHRLLQPDASILGAELDDESGALGRKRLDERRAVMGTLQSDVWERWRIQHKARAPHVVSTVKAFF
jgi:hypothetical protein